MTYQNRAVEHAAVRMSRVFVAAERARVRKTRVLWCAVGCGIGGLAVFLALHLIGRPPTAENDPVRHMEVPGVAGIAATRGLPDVDTRAAATADRLEGMAGAPATSQYVANARVQTRAARRSDFLVEEADWGGPVAVLPDRVAGLDGRDADRSGVASVWVSTRDASHFLVFIRGTLSSHEAHDQEFGMELQVARGGRDGHRVEGIIRYGQPLGAADYANRLVGEVRDGRLLLSEVENLWAKRGVLWAIGRTFSIDLPDINGRLTGTWRLGSIHGQLVARVGLPLADFNQLEQ